MNKKHLIKSTGVIGFATAVSRVLGFVRDIVIANFFGTGMAAQAFFVAFRIPNSLRDLVGEGATNAAIVPVLTGYKAKGEKKEFLRVSRVLFNISFASLSVLTLIGIIISPLIVRLIAPGFIREPSAMQLTVQLNRMIFPYLILIGLTAYTMGILNTERHFAGPAFGPCFLNLALILAGVWLCPRIGVAGLVIGVLVGGVLQLALNMAVMYKKEITIDFREGFRHPAVKKIGLLLVPRAFGSAIYQVNIFVDTMLASLSWIVGSGGVAALYYASRLIQFPLAIFGLALAQAALPKMSHEFSTNDMTRLKDTLSFSLRMTFLIMVPASVGLAVLGKPIIKMLFQRGEFTDYSTYITNSALFFYAFGLCAYGGVKLLVTCFYSMQDTMTPVKTALISVILNVALNLILMRPMKLGGLALATSISATVNFLMLYYILKKRIGCLGTKEIADSFLRVLLAGVIMGIVLKFTSANSTCIISILSSMAAGAASFLAAAYILRVKEFKKVFAWASKRR
ncbi:MAG: murein biosynthesis integral membrane protein MurJ [Candidatus Omnitrophota bacterium]|nr:murein biosynthesis integral membrane protein MurJ [Candidatus Omnitrophota bacterium]